MSVLVMLWKEQNRFASRFWTRRGGASRSPSRTSIKFGAGNETRTRDPDLGKVVLYQLSYSRPGIRQAVGACGTRIVGTAARVSSHCIGPVLSALGTDVVGKDIKRCLESEGVVWALGIEPVEPVEQAIVEARQIVEEQLLVNVDELLLDGAVEALAVGVHLRGAWEGVPVHGAVLGHGA